MADAGTHHWTHDLDPFVFHLDRILPFVSHDIGPRWYGLAYIAGIVCGYLLLRRWSRRGRVPLAPNEVQDFALAAGLAMIIGGRLGYCLFYNLHDTLRNPLYLFQLWKGGMASHGGIMGFAVGIWIWARRHGRSYLVLGDAACAVGPIGVFFGRIANFINGELWGRPTDVPWAVIFRQSGTLQPRHPSQLYAAVAEGLLPFLIMLPIHARHRRPGLTMGVFFLLYSVARFSDEFFREPDDNKFLIGWLTEGQALTLPMVVIGFAMLAYAFRRPPRPELYPAPLAPPSAPRSAPPSGDAAAT